MYFEEFDNLHNVLNTNRLFAPDQIPYLFQYQRGYYQLEYLQYVCKYQCMWSLLHRTLKKNKNSTTDLKSKDWYMLLLNNFIDIQSN